MNLSHWAAPIIALALAVPLGPPAPSRPVQQTHCDSLLSPPPGNAYGYRLRGDRCEGVYVREVAGRSTLLLASLTEVFGEFDPKVGDHLLVGWTGPTNSDVRLRSYSLRRKLYYRMDTTRPPGDTSYQWPTHLLRTLGLRRTDLGVLGWTSLPVGGPPHDVYIPLRIQAPDSASPARRIQMVILAGVELNEVYVSLAPVREDGSAGTYLQRDQPLKYGYYPADRGVRIPLPVIERPGVYLVEVGATLRSGGSSTTRFWLYHSGT